MKKATLLLPLVLACGSSNDGGPAILPNNDGGAPIVDPKVHELKTLADGVESADSIAIDASTVYVVSDVPNGKLTLVSIPKTSGPPKVLTELRSNTLRSGLCHALATNGEFLFYIATQDPPATGYALFKLPVGGGTPSVLIAYVPGGNDGCVAYDDGYVYAGIRGGIQRIRPEGGAPDVVVDETAMVLAIAVAAGHVCYVKNKTAVAVVPVTGGTPKVLAGDLGNTDTVAASSKYCYAGTNKVTRLPIEGGPGTVLASDVGIHGLVADEAGVYWTNTRGERSVGMALGDGAAVELVKSGGARDVAVDATRVFFTSESEAAVRSVTK